MQLVYAFIYYFTIFMTLCVASLAIFLIPLMRRLLVKFWRGYQHLMESDIVRYAVLLSFSLIGLVFLQSGYTLFVLESHFSTRSERLVRRLGGLEKIDLVVPEMKNREGYLMALKEYREFYLAERNILLVVSACFTFFVFQRLLYNIRKYAQIEHDMEDGGSRMLLEDGGHAKHE